MIQVNSLSKKFKLYSNPLDRALEWVMLGQKKFHQEFWALRNISFNVQKGECLGIIGPNGAGKSTLLKILTRALYPTGGSFEINGRVLSLLELGTGFNYELTGRQNLYHSAHLLGLPDEYLKDCIFDIESFAQLGEFFDRPVKLYSTGMYVRLAFSMFVFFKPEVLIIDETLSVGDIFFQQKSFAKMREIISGGTTCLFVSHDTSAIQNLCERAILLENGEMTFIGNAVETVSRYFGALGGKRRNGATMKKEEKSFDDPVDLTMASADIVAHNILSGGTNRHGQRGMEVVAARITDASGMDTLQVQMMEALNFYLLLRAHDYVASPSAGIHLFDRLGNLVFASGTRQMRKRLQDMYAGDEIMVRLELKFNVQPGEYTFSLGSSEPLPEENPNIGLIHDRHELLGPLVVTADSSKLMPFYGIAQLPMRADYAFVSKKQ